MGVECAMVTGDSRAAAEAVCKQVCVCVCVCVLLQLRLFASRSASGKCTRTRKLNTFNTHY